MENPMELLGALDNAGSVFLGQYASEPLGDYYAGPNHVLPTSGTARFFSPHKAAAIKISGFGVPSFLGGVTMIISFTPAIFAGTAFMITLDG